MTLENAINRGYNLLACTALALAGLAFGTVVFKEADLLDKVDDIGFLVIGAVAVIWCLFGHRPLQAAGGANRPRRHCHHCPGRGIGVGEGRPRVLRRQYWRDLALRATLLRPGRAVLHKPATSSVCGGGVCS
jgi:hypothetical protein